MQDVIGKGWEPAMNNYLVVEPVDQSGRRWVQAQIVRRNGAATALFSPHSAGHPLANRPVPGGSKAVIDHCCPTTVIDGIDITVPLIFGGSRSLPARIRNTFRKMARW